MKQKHKIKNKLSKNIINYINSDIKLKSIFNHSLRKYKIKFFIKLRKDKPVYNIFITYSNKNLILYFLNK